MAEPITWRTVLGPSLADAARPLQQAGDSINAGFDRMMQTIQGAQAANQTAYDRGQEGQLLAFKEALANAQTPEDVAAIKAQHSALVGALDPKYRSQAVGLEDVRTAAVQQQITADHKFAEDQFLHDNQGLISQAQSLAAEGKLDEAKKVAAPLAAHPIFGEVVKNAVFNNDTLANNRVRRETETSNAAANTGRVAIERLGAANAEEAKLREQLSKAGANTVGGPGGWDAVTTELAKTIKDKDKLNTVTRFAAEAYAKNPEFRKLPVSDFAAAVQAHSADIGTGNYAPDFNVASRMAGSLNIALGNPEVQARIGNAAKQQSEISNKLSLYGPIHDEAVGGVFPGIGAALDAATARAPGTAVVAPAGMTPQAIAASPALSGGKVLVNSNGKPMLIQPGDADMGRILTDELRKAQTNLQSASTPEERNRAQIDIQHIQEEAKKSKVTLDLSTPSAPPAAAAPAPDSKKAPAPDPMLVKQAALEQDEMALGLRKSLSKDVSDYVDTQKKATAAADKAAQDKAGATYLERRIALERMGPKMGSPFGAFGNEEAKIAEVKRRREEFTRQVADAKKAR